MRAIVPILSLFLVVPAWAIELVTFESDFEEEIKPWNELQASLPGAPKEENLIRLDTGPAARNAYFIDRHSVRADSDGVVRYSILVKSSAGASTVNFEGMRCASGEWKLYAFGRPDGSWARNSRATWAPIKDRETAGYHRELFYHYFCTVDGHGDIKVIQRALKSGGVRRGEETNF